MTVGCKTGVGGFADGLADGLGRAKGLRAVVSSKKGGAVYSEGVVKKQRCCNRSLGGSELSIQGSLKEEGRRRRRCGDVR